MAHVTLSDGRSIELRPMWISDRLKIAELSARAETEGLTVIERMQEYASIVERAIDSKSWDGSLLDMTEGQLLMLIRDWSRATEDDTLPPAQGTPSETDTPELPSAALTAARSGSASRSSTRSGRSRARGASRPGS